MLRPLRTWLARVATSINRSALDRTLSEELDAHIRLQADDFIRMGMAPAAARREALIKLGGVSQTLEQCWDVVSVPWIVRLVDRLHLARAVQCRHSCPSYCDASPLLRSTPGRKAHHYGG